MIPRPPRPTLLLSHRLGAETSRPLLDRFPHLRVVTLSEDGVVPEDARDAAVLYRAGMPHAALRQALSQLPDLRWIHTASAGFNWVLIPEVVERRIRLTRTAAVLDKPIAEFAVGAALALLKRFPAFFEAQRSRQWSRMLDLRGLHGATVLVIGAGAIGRATARRFRAFETVNLGLKRDPVPLPEFDEVRPPSDLMALLARADVVVVACPLTPETRHLIGEAQLAALRPSAIIVNVARGEVIVEDALVAALAAGRLAGAALDVFTVEPLPPESPLWTLDNVILTPHVSYVDPRNHADALDEFCDNLQRFIDGEPLQHEIKSYDLGY